jgi:hypothetical protein
MIKIRRQLASFFPPIFGIAAEVRAFLQYERTRLRNKRPCSAIPMNLYLLGEFKVGFKTGMAMHVAPFRWALVGVRNELRRSAHDVQAGSTR